MIQCNQTVFVDKALLELTNRVNKQIKYKTLGNLGRLDEAYLAIDANEHAAFDIRERFGRHFGAKVARRHLLDLGENARVGLRARIVDVGDEGPLAALGDERVQQTRARERLVELAVAGRVPLRGVDFVAQLRVRQRRVRFRVNAFQGS